MRYYEIHDRLESKFSPLVPRGTNLRRPGGCYECSTLPEGFGPPEVLQVKEDRVDGVLPFTTWGFGGIAVKLLEFLGNDVTSCLKLGKLSDANGNIIQGFRTFVGTERIILRGNRESEHRICKSCGTLIYTYMPRDSPYVTAPQVKSGRAIYEIESMQLLINESIRERIGDRWSDALMFYEVPVLELPLDGLPVDMDLWPDEERMIAYQPNPPKWTKNE